MRRIASLRLGSTRVRPRMMPRRFPAAFASTTATGASDSSSSSTRKHLLQSALEKVPEHGWTSEAIVTAVRQNHPQVSLSYATTLQATDLVQYFMDTCNQELRKKLREEQQIDADTSTNSLPLVERLHHAIRLRLEMVASYIAMGRWHQGMALGISQPQAALVTSEQLKELIALIVQETVCTSVTKDSQQQPLSELAQLSLGAVYVATECHMLSDTSPDYQETWDFLRQTLRQWDSLREQKHLSASIPADAAFLASTLATAFGHGILSVSQLTVPSQMSSIPTPDQMWRSAMNTVQGFSVSPSSSAARKHEGGSVPKGSSSS